MTGNNNILPFAKRSDFPTVTRVICISLWEFEQPRKLATGPNRSLTFPSQPRMWNTRWRVIIVATRHRNRSVAFIRASVSQSCWITNLSNFRFLKDTREKYIWLGRMRWTRWWGCNFYIGIWRFFFFISLFQQESSKKGKICKVKILNWEPLIEDRRCKHLGFLEIFIKIYRLI